jgi:hypothetical protein
MPQLFRRGRIYSNLKLSRFKPKKAMPVAWTAIVNAMSDNPQAQLLSTGLTPVPLMPLNPVLHFRTRTG